MRMNISCINHHNKCNKFRCLGLDTANRIVNMHNSFVVGCPLAKTMADPLLSLVLTTWDWVFSFEHTFFYGDSTIPGRVRRIHGTRLVVPEGDPVEGTVQFRGAVEMSSRSGELGARSTSSHDEELPDGLFVLTSM